MKGQIRNEIVNRMSEIGTRWEGKTNKLEVKIQKKKMFSNLEIVRKKSKKKSFLFR